MFFNVSHEKLGRPGQFYDIMMMYWIGLGRGWLFLPTRPCNFLHVEQLSSTKKYTAAKCTSQGIQIERNVSKRTTERAQD